MTLFGMVNVASSVEYTLAAIDSFYQHTPLENTDQLVLIDNDNSFPTDKNWPAFMRMNNATPLSFASNVNQLLRMAAQNEADVVFLNNDMIFTPNWLKPLCQRDDAILIPRCNQHIQYNSATFNLKPFMDWSEYAGHEQDLIAISQHHAQAHAPEQITEALHLSFYCFRLPYAIYGTVGLFDEGFGPGGGEDVDYRMRVNQAGFKVAYADHSYVLHFMGKSTWRGGEDAAATQQRDLQYKTAFEKKWGAELLQLFLLGQADQAIVEKHQLHTALAEHDYAKMITSCQPKTNRFRNNRQRRH
ncbi:MAG: hypothetical protein HOM11_17025 [Methylococcales bacterium]|jgi:hypothetical protein|nr:hypothetical protein [Methylococcales bacterium]MBT7444432.1 hypothetical protein [Methylococcales bacterium]